MPIRNEAPYIRRGLGSVMAQAYPPERLQILVVDGMSDDETRLAVEEIIASHPGVDARLFDNPKRIVPSALNIGLAHADGDVIVRVDGHCAIPADYVSRCVALLRQHPDVDCVGGPIETVGETKMAQTISLAMSSPFGVGGSAFRTLRGRTTMVDTLAFGAYRREAIERCGRFDEELVRNQDEEYNYRLRSLGGKLLLSDQVQSRYYSRGSLGGLWRQYFQYGSWKVRVLQKHPRQMQPRQFAPPAFVAALLAGTVLAPMSKTLRRAWIALLAVYGMANLVASLWTAARQGWRHLSLLPAAYTILHVSYGAGFLAGLVRFRKRWGDRQGHTPVMQADGDASASPECDRIGALS